MPHARLNTWKGDGMEHNWYSAVKKSLKAQDLSVAQMARRLGYNEKYVSHVLSKDGEGASNRLIRDINLFCGLENEIKRNEAQK
jgi:AraC-like DNA-binding protein